VTRLNKILLRLKRHIKHTKKRRKMKKKKMKRILIETIFVLLMREYILPPKSLLSSEN